MALAAAGPMTLQFPVRVASSTPKSSACNKFVDRYQPVSNAVHFRTHCSRLISSSSQLKCRRDQRNEFHPFLHLFQDHTRDSSASPSPLLDSQDAEDSHSFEPSSSTIWGNQYGVLGICAAALVGLGLFLGCAVQFPEAALATATVPATGTEASFPTVMTFAGAEPSNALSLPTWVIHVASVVEWVTAMALVWKYGDTEGKSAWKGLTWGMVPLLGGAMCACTWHFFYSAESLEMLVVLQAFLTVVGTSRCGLLLTGSGLCLQRK